MPKLARFTARDPLLEGEAALFGRLPEYAYVHNNPANFIDPSGLIDCRVCGGARLAMRVNLAALDAAVKFIPFQTYANTLVLDLNVKWKSAGIRYNRFTKTGFHSALNKAPNAIGLPANTIKDGFFLFFVTWDVCESKDSRCHLFLDETGSTIKHRGKITSVGKDQGEISGRVDVMRSQELINPYNGCITMLIYGDAPGSFAVLKNVPGKAVKGSMELDLKQKLTVKDKAGNVVDTFSHSLAFKIDENGVVTGPQ